MFLVTVIKNFIQTGDAEPDNLLYSTSILSSVRQGPVSLKHDGTDGTAGTAQQSTGNVACCSARDWTPEQ